MTPAPRDQPVPAVLRLVQSVVLGRWRASMEPLYRELAELLEAEDGKELLVSGCGDGRNAEWMALRSGAALVAVDPDSARMHAATARVRTAGRAGNITFQSSPLDDLPFDDAVFDGAMGDPVLAASPDPAKAVAELVRVVKPFAPVVLVQMTWNADFDAEERAAVVARLGLGLRHLVHWKQMMREAGLVEIEVQDWTDRGDRGQAEALAPFTLQQKLQIASRAWRRWGWRAARDAVERETMLLQDLAQERSVGFHVLRGVKWPHGRDE